MFGLPLWLVIVIAGIAAFFFMAMVFASFLRKVAPNEALIVYGLRGTRVVTGHGTIVMPIIEHAHELSLELMSFDVAPKQDLYTKQGVAVTVEAGAPNKGKRDNKCDKNPGEEVFREKPGERARR